MEVVTDPDNYETSQIVQKSSKSGLFSNKRLLVIKNGFLYYFTNVPSNYKYHVPNILTTFKQLPKSSIEIKTIQQIKMESSNSTNLIIKFYEKDMIEREDIRKSISDQNYRFTKKIGQELQQWKFTYAKVLNCRLWYTALLKLKAYFSKQDDKIEMFFNGFDPVKRNTLMPPVSKDIANNGSNNFRASEIMTKFKQEDKQKQLNKPKQKSLQKKSQQVPPQIKSPTKSQQQQQQLSPKKKPEQENSLKEFKLEVIAQDEELKNKKLEDEYREEIEEQIRLQQKKKHQLMLAQMNDQLESKNNKIKLLEDAIKATERLRVKEEKEREKQREKERERQIQIEKELEQQKNKIKQSEIQRQMEIEKQAQRKKIEQIQRQQKLKRKNLEQNQEQPIFKQFQEEISIFDNRSSIPLNQNRHSRSIEMNEFSVQTDEEDQQDFPNFRLSSKKRNDSYLSGFTSTQRDTFNIFRNAASMSFEMDQNEKSYDDYDYYTEVQAIQNSQIKFQQRVKRQVKLINYVKKMKDIALETFKDYIDQNQPSKSIIFRGTLFEINIVCSQGKIINLNGEQKLVYSNTEHQKIKREFKIYNYLQDKFIELSEKRKRFPLRVPLCFFFEYMGYSGLLKYLPYIKPIQSEEQNQRVLKLFKKIVQEQNIPNYQFHLIANRSNNIYMVSSINPYKITNQSQFLKIDTKRMYGPNFIIDCRNTIKSSNSTKLESEIVNVSQERSRESMKKIMGLNHAVLCRALKNLFRSTQHFTYDVAQKKQNFLSGFLSDPESYRNLVSDNCEIIINGLFISYFQFFFGLKLPSDFNIYNSKPEEIPWNYEPQFRMFSLSSLYPNKLFKNLEDYISSEKYDIAQTAFEILSQISQQDYSLEILKIKYQLKRERNINRENVNNMIKILFEIQHSIGKHNTLYLECFMLIIQCQTLLKKYDECLKTINDTLQYVSYMFGPEWSEGQTEDYLYLLVAQTLAKMNNHENSMKIYSKLLENQKSCLSQQQICLSIAQIYSNIYEIDPPTLIEFLLSTIAKKNLARSNVGTQNITLWQSKINKVIGILYNKIGNIDPCVRHLEESLNFYEKNGAQSEDAVNQIVEICLTLFNSYKQKKDRDEIFNKFIRMIEINSQNEKFSIHVIRMCKTFLTACFCQQIKSLDRSARKTISQALQQLRSQEPCLPVTVHPVTSDDFDKTIMKLSQRIQFGLKEARVIELLDINQIQIFNIALG